ncbi:MerR family transcriptional regulator [Actinoplanes sp. NPDC051859]|uniref:MerR family transcriptional regulator n=1 Tax=Actinoplanes sp. NPDC051859 TaxID=3363909 RepID=UPI0037872EA2
MSARGVVGDLEGGSAVREAEFCVGDGDDAVRPDEAGPEPTGLSAGAVARRLGVAPTTLRTWHQRYGLGPSGHEHGRHRRYTADDLDVLAAMARLTARGMPAAEAARMARRADLSGCSAPEGDPATASAARGIARAARRLDVLTLRETLAAAVAERGVVPTWHVLAAPAFVHLSRARVVEPLRDAARRVLGRCLSEVFAAVVRPPAGTDVRVVLAAPPRSRDLVALDALAAALAEQGVGSLHLGAVPDAALLAEVASRIRPAVVVLWSHAPHDVLPDLVVAAGSPLVVGAGRGWDGQPGVEVGATLADCVALSIAALR